MVLERTFAWPDKTSVIVGLYGPVEASTKEELIDRAAVQVTFSPAAGQSSMWVEIRGCT
jgi:hypothetical protein